MTKYQTLIPKHFEGTIEGKNTHLLLLKNEGGMQVLLTDYGARIVSILVPDNKGNLVDVALGFDSIQAYLDSDEKYHGCTAGRFANRIAAGKFEIDGKHYTLPQNNGNNCLHGGISGFHDKVWDRRVTYQSHVEFYYVSPDGEEGFPGNLKVMVSYTLTRNNEIIIKYHAQSDADTHVNLTNHTYFNLDGEGSGDVLQQILQINSNEVLFVDDNQIPNAIVPVEGTAFDFRIPKPIVQDITANNEQLIAAKGYDHCYVNNQPISQPCATVYSKNTGIQLDVFTTEPGVQLYTANWMTGNDYGKRGYKYLPYAGFCLETQHFPDTPNQAEFPSTLLKAGESFDSETHFKFSIKK
ncbi:aldose epimerase family protein [Sphingobacterium siyangense]|uniref:aldose epimerase family protein n=1 Tax=Sphingobacterium siyangense TaxID=459529 RepID=UPI002FDA082C